MRLTGLIISSLKHGLKGHKHTKNLVKKESKELNLVNTAEDLEEFLEDENLIENKRDERKFNKVLKNIRRNDMAVKLRKYLAID